MTPLSAYRIILFESVNHAMWADSILKSKDITHKLIPIPRHISSDCGVCIRIGREDEEKAAETLQGMEVEWSIREME